MSQRGLIASFTEHRLAANLLMLLMLMAGLYGLQQLNRQLFPTFDFDYITVSVPWRGASPEDIERALTKVRVQKGEIIERARVKGANHFYVDKRDELIGLCEQYLHQRLEEAEEKLRIEAEHD